MSERERARERERERDRERERERESHTSPTMIPEDASALLSFSAVARVAALNLERSTVAHQEYTVHASTHLADNDARGRQRGVEVLGHGAKERECV